jgi:hypothetical protein
MDRMPNQKLKNNEHLHQFWMVLPDPHHNALSEFVGYFDHLLQILVRDASS